jgi:hypothetical protein
LGNTTVSHYYIYKFKNELRLIYLYNSSSGQRYRSEFVIESINTKKSTSTGNIIIPGFISVGDSLEGIYKEGYIFKFNNILQYEILEGGYSYNEQNKKVY